MAVDQPVDRRDVAHDQRPDDEQHAGGQAQQHRHHQRPSYAPGRVLPPQMQGTGGESARYPERGEAQRQRIERRIRRAHGQGNAQEGGAQHHHHRHHDAAAAERCVCLLVIAIDLVDQ